MNTSKANNETTEGPEELIPESKHEGRNDSFSSVSTLPPKPESSKVIKTPISSKLTVVPENEDEPVQIAPATGSKQHIYDNISLLALNAYEVYSIVNEQRQLN